MHRPNQHETWLLVAHVIAGRGTCLRRRVGCVLTDAKGYVLSTGFNGPGPGQIHCIDSACPGASYGPGQRLDLCDAIHAEQNALITCADVGRVAYIYTTVAPCRHCVKMLLRTSAQELYFIEPYSSDGRDLWERSSRRWIQYSSPQLEMVQLLSSAQFKETSEMDVVSFLQSNVRVG